jgi:hypothetical protein
MTGQCSDSVRTVFRGYPDSFLVPLIGEGEMG